MYMHAYLPSFLYSLAMPTQIFLVNPVWRSHVTEDLLGCMFLCLIVTNNDGFNFSLLVSAGLRILLIPLVTFII